MATYNINKAGTTQLIDNNYKKLKLNDVLNFQQTSNNLLSWKIPYSGTFLVTIQGAPALSGGYPGKITANLKLKKGDKLSVNMMGYGGGGGLFYRTGGAPKRAGGGGGGGGGGGTNFVASPYSSYLLSNTVSSSKSPLLTLEILDLERKALTVIKANDYYAFKNNSFVQFLPLNVTIKNSVDNDIDYNSTGEKSKVANGHLNKLSIIKIKIT